LALLKSEAQSPETSGQGVLPSGDSEFKNLNHSNHAEPSPRLENAPRVLPLTHRNLSENNRLYADTSKRDRRAQPWIFKADTNGLDLGHILSVEKWFEGMMPMERFLAEIGVSDERKAERCGRIRDRCQWE
jgi:hypothetical protein